VVSIDSLPARSARRCLLPADFPCAQDREFLIGQAR
jgi:hypothetical protein